jgi:hypothetical protein
MTAATTKPMFPPGHFYSPIPALEEIERDRDRIFAPPPTQLPGIDLNGEYQLALVEAFAPYHDDMPFADERQPGLRYWFRNPAYSYTDAIFLHAMIRHHRPRRIIEVGSGYSSCVTLDTNERWFDNTIACTFVEPYPKLLRSLLAPDDEKRIEIIGERVQDVPVARFRELQGNDILFIDSTHVSKTGSDVNYLFFEVLPALAPGVLVHVHDIFYPFEYPSRWVMEGRAWNENYLLRAFLQFNTAFRIELFANWLATFHREVLLARLPKCAGNLGGNIWLRRAG